MRPPDPTECPPDPMGHRGASSATSQLPLHAGLSPWPGGDTKQPGRKGQRQGKAWTLQTALISLEDVSESCTGLEMSPIIILSHL